MRENSHPLQSDAPAAHKVINVNHSPAFSLAMSLCIKQTLCYPRGNLLPASVTRSPQHGDAASFQDLSSPKVATDTCTFIHRYIQTRLEKYLIFACLNNYWKVLIQEYVNICTIKTLYINIIYI